MESILPILSHQDLGPQIVDRLNDQDRGALALSCHDANKLVKMQYALENGTFPEKVQKFAMEVLRKTHPNNQRHYRESLSKLGRFFNESLKSSKLPKFVKEHIQELFFSTFTPFNRLDFYKAIEILLSKSTLTLNVKGLDLESEGEINEQLLSNYSFDEKLYAQLLEKLEAGMIDCETVYNGESLLFHAIKQGDLSLLKLLLDLGANIEQSFSNDQLKNITPLVATFQLFINQSEILIKPLFEELLIRGANIEAEFQIEGEKKTVKGLLKEIVNMEFSLLSQHQQSIFEYLTQVASN